MIDTQVAMVQVLQATLDAEGEGPGDLTKRVRQSSADLSPEQFTETVLLLKASRCLDVTEGPRTDEGRTIESINSITTRGLRELQKASMGSMQVHSCPTDGDDGNLGLPGG